MVENATLGEGGDKAEKRMKEGGRKGGRVEGREKGGVGGYRAKENAVYLPGLQNILSLCLCHHVSSQPEGMR